MIQNNYEYVYIITSHFMTNYLKFHNCIDSLYIPVVRLLQVYICLKNIAFSNPKAGSLTTKNATNVFQMIRRPTMSQKEHLCHEKKKKRYFLVEFTEKTT